MKINILTNNHDDIFSLGNGNDVEEVKKHLSEIKQTKKITSFVKTLPKPKSKKRKNYQK